MKRAMQGVNEERRSGVGISEGTFSEGTFKVLVVLIWLGWMLGSVLSATAQGNPSPGAASFEPMTPSQAKTGRLLFQTNQQGLYEAAPGVETDVFIQVTGFVSRTVLRQSFRNPGESWREGVYVFPLPDGSAVDAMRLVIGDRIIEGEIQERQHARRTYERARRAGKKASLVEQERPNLFTTSVANIGPGELVEVVIEYQEDVRYDSGMFRLRFPMVVNPRYVPPVSVVEDEGSGSPTPDTLSPVVESSPMTPPVLPDGSADVNLVNLAVELDAGMSLEVIQSWSHELAVSETESGKFLVEFEAGMVPADRDFVLEWKPEQGEVPQATVFLEQHGDAEYLLLMVMPPKPSADTIRVPKETVFVLDRSGSMAGAPMRQAKKALIDALERLPAGDHFNVVLFSHEAERLFESSVPADPSYVEIAKRRLESVGGDGGTEMLGALELALEEQEHDLGLRQVIFMTDGSVGNEDELFGYIRTHLGRSRLFTVGIGSAPNSYFMRKSAELGSGTFTFIDDLYEVESKMTELFNKIEHPVLRDLQLHWSDPEAEAWPRRPGDLYLGEPLMVTARSKNGFDDLLLEGWAGRSAWDQHLLLQKSGETRGIHKLWARKKVESLMDSLVAGADRETVRQQVVDLGLRHHLVTRHTSLVAVDKTPSRPEHEALRSAVVPVRRPAGVLPRGGTASRLQLLTGLLLLLGAWRLRRGP